MIPSDPSCQRAISSDIFIRHGTPNDLDEVTGLAHVSATAARWSRAAFYPYVAEETVVGGLQEKVLFVACAGEAAKSTSPVSGEDMNPAVERIVGFAALSAIMTVGTGESTMENMAVAEPWRKQGIGGRLLSAGLLWCRAHAALSVFLEVRETNRVAIALYERAGFPVVGRRPAYYRDPAEAALQMQKILDPVAQSG